MKQPRVNQTLSVMNSDGTISSVVRSVALEGGPSGAAQYGPIERDPITGDVLYRADMVKYRGTYYSPDGLEEVIERDRKRNN